MSAASELTALIGSVEAKLAAVGTSLPDLGEALGEMVNEVKTDPAGSALKVAELGAEVAFPQAALAIEIGAMLVQSGIFKPAQPSDLVETRTDGNAMDRDV